MRIQFFIVALVVSQLLWAQQKNGLVSGPWAGNIELRNAVIWLEVAPEVKTVAVQYNQVAVKAAAKLVTYKGALGNAFNPIKIELNGLNPNTTYNYSVLIDGKPTPMSFATRFTTKELWQWRKPAPDFSFLAGSCAYFNEPIYDRPSRSYGGDSSIFETMANTPASFHIWLGDNWYTREVDFYSAWGLQYRASRDRSMPVLQKFMASMPQYAIWDDHDYGPNDQGKSYIFKDEARSVFMKYSLNPTYGQNGQGIYSQFGWNDVDFFLTDDRTWRSEQAIEDSTNGQWNGDKTYFGAAQMDWLKNALLFSKATFKIIATGSQVLNPATDFDCMCFYKKEYQELMDFLAHHNIKGVLFFTGDRHHSEVIKLERPGKYPLYDITNSPYTSGVGKVRGKEADNKWRIPGTLVEAQNFTKASVSGEKGNRTLKVEFLGLKGEKLAEWSVNEKELTPAPVAKKD
jgi:alkaline phosphatase D